MTWYANRIYVNGSEAVRARLREERTLADHVFLLSGTLPASWEPDAPEIALPDEGLICIKEISAGDEDWYSAEEWLSWTALEGPPQRALLDEVGDGPPPELLRFLGDLHDRCGVTVSYYLGSTWGGELEKEAAWVFGETDVVYRHCGTARTQATDAGGSRLLHQDLLVLTLAHHGIRMPSPYFAPHTRPFDWERRRLR